jgi:hypothetical protein
VTCEPPSPEDVWRAVDAYLAVAYEGAPPAAVAERLSVLRAAAAAAFYECDAFERCGQGYALRLGNRHYPHMKLVLEPAPGGRFVFRADTHDRHFLHMVNASSAGFAELLERNAGIARAIEAAWSACGVFTPRAHLHDQLARWRATRR